MASITASLMLLGVARRFVVALVVLFGVVAGDFNIGEFGMDSDNSDDEEKEEKEEKDVKEENRVAFVEEKQFATSLAIVAIKLALVLSPMHLSVFFFGGIAYGSGRSRLNTGLGLSNGKKAP